MAAPGILITNPTIQGSPPLTANLLSQAPASVGIAQTSRGQRCLRFSGYDWLVKSAVGGPGPNNFSDSTNNVWLDTSGRMHLRITHRSNQWQCAEIYSTKSLGYGSYRFRLDSRVDNFDARVVLGLFTYSNDPVYNNREIDIEFGRWANRDEARDGQFVVQPAVPEHRVRFTMPVGLANSTHQFTWESNRIVFQSLRGAYSPRSDPSDVLTEWTYTSSGVPQAGDENTRMNLWLYQGIPPADLKEVEVVIQSFEFVPLK